MLDLRRQWSSLNFHGGSAKVRPGKLSSMKKPNLVIESKPDASFLNGIRSSCPAVRFKLPGNTLGDKRLLRGMFDLHFKRAHLKGDASQATARIVKEATKD